MAGSFGSRMRISSATTRTLVMPMSGILPYPVRIAWTTKTRYWLETTVSGRLRASTTKTRQALWVELPDVLAKALEASLGPREDRRAEAPLFPDATADRLRTAIARACKALGVPVFSPHDLRHRRISLLHRQGRSWAEIARFVGQRKLSFTADTYSHVMSDGQEVVYGSLV
jgi:integrase